MNSARAETRAQLLNALLASESEVATFFGSLSPDDFTRRVDAAWSPAEHLQHLNMTVSAVGRGLSIPYWLLLLRFGVAFKPARSFDEVRAAYRSRLAGGAVAPPQFVPRLPDLPGGDSAALRADLLARWQRVNARLRTALERWSEKALDRFRLPHPLLGNISAREMTLFTLYHNRHHIAGARSRLPAA